MSIMIKGSRIGQADVVDIDIVEGGCPRHIGLVRVGDEIRQWVDGFNRSYMHDVHCNWDESHVDITVNVSGAVSATESARIVFG